MTITFDRSQRTILVVCDCGFRRVTMGPDEANRTALEHVRWSHVGDRKLAGQITSRVRRAQG